MDSLCLITAEGAGRSSTECSARIVRIDMNERFYCSRSASSRMVERVNAIALGSILTGGTRSLFYNEANRGQSESRVIHVPLGKPGEAEDSAYATLFLGSGADKCITRPVLVVGGG